MAPTSILAIAWSVGTVFLMPADFRAQAEEVSLDAEVAVSTFGQWVGVASATDLVPSPAESGYRSSRSGFEATFRLKSAGRILSLDSQLRAKADSGNEATAYVDEAFGELKLGERLFAYAGRRILSFGQSYGLNPADLYLDPRRLNDILWRSEARSRVEGVNMLGMDILFDDGRALSWSLAPNFDHLTDGQEKDYAVLRFSGYGNDGMTDYAVSAMSGGRPGVGLSLSSGIGEALVLYMDATVRQSRDRHAITDVSPVGDLTLAPRDNGDFSPFATFGFGHFHANGLSVNVEYTHDAAGYSDSEWQRIRTALDIVTPVASATHGQTLQQINALLDRYTLRQNYGFVRLAHDAAFNSMLAVEVAVLHGVDDGSGSVGLRLEYPLADHITVGLAASRKYGRDNMEFTIRPETASIAIYASMRFLPTVF